MAQAIREADEARLLAVLASADFAEVTLDESSAGSAQCMPLQQVTQPRDTVANAVGIA